MLCNLINESRQAMNYNVTFRRARARVCVYVALGIQYAMRMCHTIICGMLRSTFFHIISSTAQLSGKKVIEHKTCVSTTLSETFSFYVQEELNKIRSNMNIGLHVKYPSFLSDVNET